MEELVKQEENKPKRDEKGRLLPGNTANPNGRPAGKTLKEYMADKFRTMSDQEREEFLKNVPWGEKWRMAEGNPHQSSDVKVELPPIPIINVSRNNSDSKGNESNQEN